MTTFSLWLFWTINTLCTCGSCLHVFPSPFSSAQKRATHCPRKRINFTVRYSWTWITPTHYFKVMSPPWTNHFTFAIHTFAICAMGVIPPHPSNTPSYLSPIKPSVNTSMHAYFPTPKSLSKIYRNLFESITSHDSALFCVVKPSPMVSKTTHMQ